jgi:hypothetical protein
MKINANYSSVYTNYSSAESSGESLWLQYTQATGQSINHENPPGRPAKHAI